MDKNKLISNIPHLENHIEKSCLTLLINDKRILIFRNFQDRILWHLFDERNSVSYGVNTEDEIINLFK